MRSILATTVFGFLLACSGSGGGGGDPDADAGTGTLPGTGASSSGGSSSSGASSSGASSSSSSSGGASSSGMDSGAGTGTGGTTHPECASFASVYCGCLGSIAAADCVATITSGCDDGFDACPAGYETYTTCVVSQHCAKGWVDACKLDTSSC